MFKNIFEINSKINPDNSISDASCSITYKELEKTFEQLNRRIQDENIRENACFAIKVKNDLPNVIVILWMLYSERNFMLLPSSVQPGAEEKVPPFCNVLITVDQPSESKTEFTSLIGFSIVQSAPAAINLSPGNAFFKTSGVTGNPKFVQYSLTNLYHNSKNLLDAVDIKSEDRILIPVPIYHMYGFGAGLLSGIVSGASIKLIDNTNIVKLLSAERNFQPTILFITPLLCNMFLQAKKGCGRYKFTITAGDRIGKPLYESYEQYFGKLINLYGCTELGVIATSDINDSLAVRSDGVLKLLSKVEFSEMEHLPTVSDQFKLRFKHPFRSDFYVDRHGRQSSDKELPGKNDFGTNDLGYRVGIDKFRVLDRFHNSVNRNGFLVAFSKIESDMEKSIVGIDKVAIVSADEETIMGKKLIAFCKITKDLTAEEIRLACFSKMLHYLVPDEIQIVNEFPKTSSGKLDRQALLESILINNK